MIDNRGTGVNFCDTEEEYISTIEELESNPDFSLLGYYDSINDIYDEMEYQGFSEDQTQQLTLNRYGDCLEIVQYLDGYTAYIGAR